MACNLLPAAVPKPIAVDPRNIRKNKPCELLLVEFCITAWMRTFPSDEGWRLFKVRDRPVMSSHTSPLSDTSWVFDLTACTTCNGKLLGNKALSSVTAPSASIAVETIPESPFVMIWNHDWLVVPILPVELKLVVKNLPPFTPPLSMVTTAPRTSALWSASVARVSTQATVVLPVLVQV